MNLEKNRENFQKLAQKNKPKAIIFDWDNTLANSWPVIAKAINMTMEKFGKEAWSLKKVKDEVHLSMRESFPILFGENWQEAGNFYKNSYRSINLKNISLLENSLKLIDFLNEMQIPQFIVSNKIGTTLRKELNKIDILDKFHAVIGAQDADADKPSVLPVELALKFSQFSLNDDDIWFIGDTISDINCAYNCGFQPIIFDFDGVISKSIDEKIYQNGKNNEGAIPFYDNHQDLINLLKKFD